MSETLGMIALSWALVALLFAVLTGDSPRKWFR